MQEQEVYRKLQQQFGPDAKLDEPMWRHTSFRVGGPVSLLVIARTSRMLEQIVPLVAGSGVPWRVLGGATNVLVADAGIRGCVISVDSDKPVLNLIEERPSVGGPEVVVRVAAGCKLILVARKAVDQGLGGLEWAIGIPGTIGGAAVNNAGAHGSDISALFEGATAVDGTGKLVRLTRDDMDYSYRRSTFKASQRRHLALVSVDLRLARGSTAELLETANRFDATRKQRQPPGLSAGSVFRNPAGDYSGRLIETAGLKGLKIGGAQVSSLHGNFFLNTGGATAGDLYRLARAVQQGVWEKHGIWLEPEVELLGEWTEEERQALRQPSADSYQPSAVSNQQSAQSSDGLGPEDPDFGGNPTA